MDTPKTYAAFELGNTQMSGWINNFLTRRGEFMFQFPKPNPPTPPLPPINANNKIIVLMSAEYPIGYELIKYIIYLGLVTNNVETYLQKNDESILTLINRFYANGYRFFIGTQNSQELSTLITFFQSHSDCCYFNTCSTIYNLQMPSNMIRSIVNDNVLTSYINTYFVLNVTYLLSLSEDQTMYIPLSLTPNGQPAFKRFVYIYESSNYTQEFLNALTETNDPKLNISIISFLIGEDEALPDDLINLLTENPVSNLDIYQTSEKTLFFLNSSNPQNLLNKFTNSTWYDNYFFCCDPFFNDLLTTYYPITYSFLGAGCFSSIGYKLSKQVDPNQDISPIALSVVNLIIQLGQWYLNNAKINETMTDLLYKLISIQYLYQGIDNNWYWFEKQIYIYHARYDDNTIDIYPIPIFKEPLIVNASASPEVNGGYMLSNKNWTSVTYGQGIYVAVSNDGYSMRSVDGIYWIESRITGSTSQLWSSVCYGDGYFVAVATSSINNQGVQTSNRLMTSTDGNTWSIKNADLFAYTSITFGATNIFVAVAQNSPPVAGLPTTCRALWGKPPNSWYTVCSTPGYPFQGVTFGNGYFVAVSTQGIMTSNNGSNWEVYKTISNGGMVPNGTWTAITFGNEIYVAVSVSAFGSNKTVITSSDRVNWIARDALNYPWKCITFGNGIFVALSKNGKSMTSYDGIIWTERIVPNSEWTSITFGNNLFVAVASAGIYITMSSKDGINWFYGPSGYGSFMCNGTSYATGLTSANVASITSTIPPYTVSNPYTVELFFKLSSLGNSDEQLLTVGNNTSVLSNLQIKIFGTNSSIEKQGKLGVLSAMSSTGTSTELITTTIINVNEWYHVAFVKYGGSNNQQPNIALFLNGILQVSQVGNSSSTALTTKEVTVSGKFGTSTDAFNGNIADIRITKEQVYTGNFIVPSVPLQTTQSAGTNINAIGIGKCVFLTQCKFIKLFNQEVTNVALTNNGLVFSYMSP